MQRKRVVGLILSWLSFGFAFQNIIQNVVYKFVVVLHNCFAYFNLGVIIHLKMKLYNFVLLLEFVLNKIFCLCNVTV